MLYVFVITVILIILFVIDMTASLILQCLIIVLHYFSNVRIPPSFDIVSIVFDFFDKFTGKDDDGNWKFP